MDITKIYDEDIWLTVTLRQLYEISHALDAHIASGQGDDDEKKMLQIIHDFYCSNRNNGSNIFV